MLRAVLILDNLRMGGFQRLALDQAYALSEKGYSVNILVLSPPLASNQPNFLTIEQDMLHRLRIQITYLGDSRFRQFITLNLTVRKLTPNDLLISHTLRGTALLSIQKLRFGPRVKLITTIHQLPTLSAPKQRFKRYCYAQLTDVLTGYSAAVEADWIEKIDFYPKFIRFCFKKELHVLRNGIYLKRLPDFNLNSTYQPRLIYLGRSASWKGMDNFFKIASHPLLSSFKILMMVPNQEDVLVQSLRGSVRDRLHVNAGKSISSLSPQLGDVHIYPADYGAKTNFVESVSLNCLELASIGIPSILTKNGTSTWPDLEDFSIFNETSWENLDEVAGRIVAASTKMLDLNQLNEIRSIISIENNISRLINISNGKISQFY